MPWRASWDDVQVQDHRHSLEHPAGIYVLYEDAVLSTIHRLTTVITMIENQRSKNVCSLFIRMFKSSPEAKVNYPLMCDILLKACNI